MAIFSILSGLFGRISLKGGLVIALSIAVLAAYIMHKKYSAAVEEIARQQVVIEKARENLELVTKNLGKEQVIREKTTQALQQLGSSGEDYESPLPPRIAATVRDFRDRMLEQDSNTDGK